MYKYIQYLSYILRHKWYVFLECRKLGIPWTGVTHDLSKFRPSEFFPYVNHFYGRPCVPYNKKDDYVADVAFDTAWLHHQRRNPHHWQYWLLTNDEDLPCTLEMPMRYRKEMLADWRGAHKAQGGKDLVAWYTYNQSSIELASNTKRWIQNEMRYR